MKRTFLSLKYYNYRLWFFTAIVANTGTWMQRVAQDWLVLTELTDNDAFAVGVTTALQFMPLLLITPYAGVLADRYDKRKIMYVTQSLMGLLAVGLGALVLTGFATVEIVYGFALALGTVSAFDTPPRQVFVSELVEPKHLTNAIGLNSASFNSARLIGPALAGLLIAVVGTGWVFVINGVSFGATLIGLAIMKSDRFFPIKHQPREKGQIRQAARYIRHRSDIVVILVVAGVISSLGLNFQLTSASMASEVFGKDAGEYGLLGSIMAIGSLTGALMAARRKESRVRLVVVAAFGFGIAAGVNAVMPTYWSYAISCIFVGYFTLTLLTSANMAIQTSVDPMMRGRIMALYQVVLMGSTPIGAPIVGWIAANIHPRWGIGIGAVAAIIVSIGALIWVRRNWNVTFEYRRRVKPHLVIIGPAEHAQRRQEHGTKRRSRERTLDATTQEQAALSSGVAAVPPRSATPEEP
ncbi:MFS transporter [Flaviflexus huanghaiensis]|uniref:MFS transporter n=1 Tax=Flaviflexus huanghaiensis TaxID=1111473 RepID=UPI0015FA1D04